MFVCYFFREWWGGGCYCCVLGGSFVVVVVVAAAVLLLFLFVFICLFCFICLFGFVRVRDCMCVFLFCCSCCCCLLICLSVLFCVKRRSDQQVPSAGTTLYSKIYAEDAAGHRSQVIVSDGVRVDTTPPVISSMVYSDGINLIDNPSFENDPALNADLTQCDAQPPTSWEVRYDAQTRHIVCNLITIFSFLSSDVGCDSQTSWEVMSWQVIYVMYDAQTRHIVSTLKTLFSILS